MREAFYVPRRKNLEVGAIWCLEPRKITSTILSFKGVMLCILRKKSSISNNKVAATLIILIF